MNANVFFIYFFSVLLNSALKASILLGLCLLVIRIFSHIRPHVKHGALFAAKIFIIVSALLTGILQALLNLPRFSPVGMYGMLHGLLLFLNTGFVNLDPANLLWHYVPLLRQAVTGQIHWTFCAVLVWFCGTGLSLIPVVIGRLGLKKLYRGGNVCHDQQVSELVEEIRTKLRIKQRVIVKTAGIFSVPVTFYFKTAVVLLPDFVLKNSRHSIKSVLLHELIHIKRHDCHTFLGARIFASLFWFVPFAWLSLNKQKELQEHACDYFVVREGVRVYQYAEHLLEYAKHTSKLVPLAGFSMPMVGDSLLEQRIRNIIQFKSLSPQISASERIAFVAGFIILLFFLTTLNFFGTENNNYLVFLLNPEAKITLQLAMRWDEFGYSQLAEPLIKEFQADNPSVKIDYLGIKNSE